VGLNKNPRTEQAPALLLGLVIFVTCNVVLVTCRKFVASSHIVDQLILITLGLGCVAGLLSSFSGVIARLKRMGLSRSLITWVSISAFSTFIIFGLAVPGAVQRSKSAHVILWVGESGEGMTKTVLRRRLEERFGETDFASIELRLTEQVSRGLLEDSGGVYVVTKSGRLVFEAADLLAKVYSLPGWQQASLLNISPD